VDAWRNIGLVATVSARALNEDLIADGFLAQKSTSPRRKSSRLRVISPLSSTCSRAPTMRSVGGMFQLGCQPSLTPSGVAWRNRATLTGSV
jgi:hypothetical protein